MLSFLSCVGCRHCRFSPFASMSLASHHTFRTRNCSKPRFIHQCQALFCSSPMIHIWDSHENKHKDIMKTWKRHVQCRPYTESQIRAQPSPVRPAQPNPRPTQHSAPTSVSSLFFSKIEPPQVNLFGEKKERWETNINKYLSVYRFNITKGSSSIIFWFLTSARRCVAVLASCIGLIRLGQHRCFDQVVAVEAHHSQNIRHQRGCIANPQISSYGRWKMSVSECLPWKEIFQRQTLEVWLGELNYFGCLCTFWVDGWRNQTPWFLHLKTSRSHHLASSNLKCQAQSPFRAGSCRKKTTGGNQECMAKRTRKHRKQQICFVLRCLKMNKLQFSGYLLCYFTF